FEYRLHPVGPMVLGGLMLHPFDKAKEVLQFYREFSSNLPDEADAYAGMLTSPEGQPVVALILGYNGPIEEGEKVLAPAREFGEPLADLVQPMPYMTRQSMLDDPMAIHGIQRYWKSGFTKTLDDELLDVLIGAASSFSSPMTQILFFNIHGAATRVPLGDTAFGSRESKWDFNIITQWTDAAESDRHIAWTRSHWSQIEEITDGSAYINHIAGDDKADRVPISYGENYSRLVSLKQKYDPQNLFRLNPNIKP
ncbi:MAG: BBE domain-containing protein, partial [Chloroflexi bacterium]|nr:BBE domain-containing protein [Chloroflexota bacterium]